MIAADITICNAPESAHVAVLATTATTDPDARLTLEPGDCYTTSNGERVRLTIANPYRLDKNGDGIYAKKVYTPGTYKPAKYHTSRVIVVRVR